MPRKGENLLRRFVEAVERGEGWSFGIPRLSEGAMAIALPVLRDPAPPRRYVLAEEAADGVRAEDLGRIDRLRVRNETGGRLLLRSGSLFRGTETQSRGSIAGVLIGPRSHADVEVRCVHESGPVVQGPGLELSRDIAPERVLRALLLGDQGAVWAAVAKEVTGARGAAAVSSGRTSGHAVSDDLLEALAETTGEAAVEDVPGEIPAPETQCGLFLLDARGVLAAELFDSPASWKAVSAGVLHRYARLLKPSPGSPVKSRVDPELAVRLAKEFLHGLSTSAGRGPAADGSLVDYVALDREIVHLLAIRPGRPADAGYDVLSGSERETHTTHPGTVELDDSSGLAPAFVGAPSEDGEVAVAGAVAVDLEEGSEPSAPRPRVRRRKVLTSGWDPGTFRALEHYSHKEFQGDRSGAVRFLVRNGLRRRGYLWTEPEWERRPLFLAGPDTADRAPASELVRSNAVSRIRDLERIARTEDYAGWLRERARAELERMATGAEDEALQIAARSAMDRIPLAPPPEEIHEPEPTETPPPAPPVDITGILRRALAASASGNYTQAVVLFDEILEADPVNMTALLGRAVAFRRAGKKPEALAGLDLVLRLDPRNAAALLNRGRILQERGDLKDSLETFDRLVEVAPNDWDVWMERGDVLLRMGRNEDALHSYSEALRRNPDDEELQRRTRALESLRTAPSAARARNVVMPPGIEEGQSYLAKEPNPDRTRRVFTDLAAQNVPALFVTRQPLEHVRREPGLRGVRVLGLGHKPGMDVYSPSALAPLSRAIEHFVEENHGRGMILLDGLETLVTANGFRNTLLFVEHVHEFVVQRRAIFLISVTPEGLAEREMALLERNLKILS